MLSEKRYQFIVDQVRGMALDAVWLYLEDDSESYEIRIENFLWFFERMVSEGLIELAKDGIQIRDPLEDVIRSFRHAFPDDGETLNSGVWFFTEKCPIGIGWVLPDRSVDWV